MLPELSFGPITLHTFGAMAALALIVPWWFVRADLAGRGHRPEAAFWLVTGAGVGGFVGAKLWFLAEHPDAPLLSGSGLTWYGGLIGGIAGVVVAAWAQGLPIGEVANVAAAPLALGYALGRIGCQLAGDGDYGKPSDLRWAMSYPEGTVPTTDLVHPTPVYETAASLVLFWVLWRLRGTVTAPWALFGLYLVMAGLERFLIEFLRTNPHTVGSLTTAQVVSLGLIALGQGLFATARRAARD